MKVDCPVPEIAESLAHIPATTTLEQERHYATRRHINLTWEYTQSAIAVLVVAANVGAAFYLTNKSELLANAFFLVIGFYFGRTNHARPATAIND